MQDLVTQVIDTGRPAYANATDGGKGIRVSALAAALAGATAVALLPRRAFRPLGELAAAAGEQAFERFWRGSHDDSGSGLGLAIVRATAERHGGRAYAEGSRFAPRRRLRVAGITAAPPHAATVTQ